METVKNLNCIFWHENLLLLLSFKVPLRSSKCILVGTKACVCVCLLTRWKRRQSKFVLIVLLIPYSLMWRQWSITIRFNTFALVCVFQTESICSLCPGINTIGWKTLLVFQYLSGCRSPPTAVPHVPTETSCQRKFNHWQSIEPETTSNISDGTSHTHISCCCYLLTRSDPNNVPVWTPLSIYTFTPTSF